MQRTWAQINLGKIRSNLDKVRRQVGPNCQVMGVVKADGYGLGAPTVAKTLLEGGASCLGVAWLSEAQQLRAAGITAPILLLSEIVHQPAEAEEVIRLGIHQTVYTYELAQLLSQTAKRLGRKAALQIKVDTGMHRIGVLPGDVAALVEAVSRLENVKLEGIFTHFAKADEPLDPYTPRQLELFLKILAELKDKGHEFPLRHSANSAAAWNFPKSHLDLVRVGLTLYEGALAFKSRINFIKKVPAGSRLSYGGRVVTRRPTYIATIPVGYADGFDRQLSTHGEVLIMGQRHRVVGLISMDMTLIDLGPETSVKVGDEVVLIGSQGSEEITLEEVARKLRTITYEVMCGIGKRVPRLYT